MSLPTLSKQISHAVAYPPKILQFGEGNFLRAFFDLMIDDLNRAGKFSGSIIAVQPNSKTPNPYYVEQDNLYTVLIRGLSGGKLIKQARVVSSFSRVLNAHLEFETLVAAARIPTLRFIISNTTEAGIITSIDDHLDASPPASFPGKLTRVMYERFLHFKGTSTSGFILLPCELIENAGPALRDAVLATALNWSLPETFISWIREHNIFCSTLVDRIVTGYPKDDDKKIFSELGYQDALMTTAEPYYSWIIEGPESISKELPFAEIGLPVSLTDNLRLFRQRKVRILNGAHTMSVLAAFLAGKNTVGEMVSDEAFFTLIKEALADEIVPTLDLPRKDLEAFAAATLERFGNPFVKHQLLSIALNSVSKFRARVLPSILEYEKRFGQWPARLVLSFAALIAFYRSSDSQGSEGMREGQPYPIKDDEANLNAMQTAWEMKDPSKVVSSVLSNTQMWGEDLTARDELCAAVSKSLETILLLGPRQAILSL